MQRHIWLGAVLAMSLAGPALAQSKPAESPTDNQQPPSTTAADHPQIGEANANGAKKPDVGANSFAEGQARSLIASKGYDNVSPLVNDKQGIWHGTATKDHTEVHVSVDYKGNVIAHK